jgi:hypothetical protein
MLVQDTERDMQAFLSSKQRGTTAEQRLMIYHRMVMRGLLRQAVKYLTDREKGTILMPEDIDEKTGDSVATVLEYKASRCEGSGCFLFPCLPQYTRIRASRYHGAQC